MPVNCRTCRHYHASIKAKNQSADDFESLQCLNCADYPHRKSYYEPITGGKEYSRKGDKQREMWGK